MQDKQLLPQFFFPHKSQLTYLSQINDLKIFPLLQSQSYHKAYNLILKLINQIHLDLSPKTKQFNQDNLLETSIRYRRMNKNDCKKNKEGQHNANISSKRLPHSYDHAILFFNLGLAYWKLDQKQESIEAMEKSFQLLSFAINCCEDLNKATYLRKQIILTGLQLCIMLSQVGQHSAAEKLCTQILLIVKEIIGQLLRIADNLQNECMKHKSKQQVDFKRVVIIEAKQKLEPFFDSCESTIDILFEEHHETNISKIRNIIESLYFWENSVENNEKFIKLFLGVSDQSIGQAHRNLLGINLVPDWISNFNIGQLITLKPKRMKTDIKLDIFSLLSLSNILEMNMLYSVSMFTLSTQIRFKKTRIISDKANQSVRYLQMIEDAQILRCKVLHLRAIQIAVRQLSSAKNYINHLINSFNKNYKFFMEKIEQEDSSISQIVSINNQQCIQINHRDLSDKKRLSSTNCRSQPKSMRSLNRSKRSKKGSCKKRSNKMSKVKERSADSKRKKQKKQFLRTNFHTGESNVVWGSFKKAPSNCKT